MGICETSDIILRDRFSKKLYIKKLADIIEFDYSNFQLWTNIGWSNISDIKEEINFSNMTLIQSNSGCLKITSDMLKNITRLNLPKHTSNDKWKLSTDEAFLLGYFLKYGILDNRFNLIIRDNNPHCKYIKKFIEIFDKVEGVKSFILKLNNDSDGRYIIKNIYDKLIWNKYFSFCYDLKQNKIIPNVILNSDPYIQTCFILGFLGKLNYDRLNPYKYLVDSLKTSIITTMSKQLLSGLYFICKNIGLEIITGNFIKDKTFYYYIQSAQSHPDFKNLKYEVMNINTTSNKSYNIIPENSNANVICIGIGEMAISIN